MEKFAGYGFNKSHAAAYALIAYQTAWFKAHHPAAFMAANLSLVMDDTDKVRHFRDDAIALGLTMLPPDVNASNYRFEPVDAKQIRYGLGGIKGTGQAAIEAIVAARAAGGPFRDLFDFCRRVDKRAVNRRAVEALVRAGAFDAIEPRRAALLASVGIALEAAEQAAANAAQVSLFGEEAAERSLGLVATRDWTDAERLQNEKSAVGFYLSGHPFNGFAAELAPLVRTALVGPGTQATTACWSPASSRRCACRPDDAARWPSSRSTTAAARRRSWSTTRRLRQRAQPAARRPARHRRGQGHAAHDRRRRGRGPAHHRRERLRPGGGAQEVREGPASSRATATRRPRRLAEILQPFRPGDKPITVSYRNERVGGDVALPDAWRVNLDDALLDRLRDWLQPENVQVLY